MTLLYRSCASEDDEAITRPETVERIAANAAEAMTASMIAPSVDPPASPPTTSASCGAAVLPAGFWAVIASTPTIAAAPKPSTSVIR